MIAVWYVAAWLTSDVTPAADCRDDGEAMTVLSRYLEAVTNSDIPVRVGQSVFYTYYKPDDVKNMVSGAGGPRSAVWRPAVWGEVRGGGIGIRCC